MWQLISGQAGSIHVSLSWPTTAEQFCLRVPDNNYSSSVNKGKYIINSKYIQCVSVQNYFLHYFFLRCVWTYPLEHTGIGI
jgi:hypothetical protein